MGNQALAVLDTLEPPELHYARLAFFEQACAKGIARILAQLEAVDELHVFWQECGDPREVVERGIELVHGVDYHDEGLVGCGLPEQRRQRFLNLMRSSRHVLHTEAGSKLVCQRHARAYSSFRSPSLDAANSSMLRYDT